ncbi:hypothetical protein [Deinococcus aquatilis]|uniref:hypothetical protein n=1 Tax=Deinococcus aquatilis TaxID=519440 RepID=UPI0003670C6C|nr:hypothetical protein [Deinococcus aquatilis]
MRESDWRAWVDSLPSSRPQLQEVQAHLERQAVLAEVRLTAAIWKGGRKAEERTVRVELNDLNSQLLFIRTQLKVV